MPELHHRQEDRRQHPEVDPTRLDQAELGGTVVKKGKSTMALGRSQTLIKHEQTVTGDPCPRKESQGLGIDQVFP